MPIFNQQLRSVDPGNTREALKAMEKHIRYIQEQLEYTLTNLDSSNVTEIETDVTNITSSTGGATFSGDSVKLTGKNGETFEAGIGTNSQFQFKLNGKNGTQIFYLTSTGELVITNNATISIDCGEW